MLNKQIKHHCKIHRHNRKHPKCFQLFNDYYGKRETILITHSTGCHLGTIIENNSDDFAIEPPKFDQLVQGSPEQMIWISATQLTDAYYIEGTNHFAPFCYVQLK